MGKGASRIVDKDLQNIPRDVRMIAEVTLRGLPDRLAEEMAQYNNDYPLRASHALSPGNVQDAASVVRNDTVFEGNFGGGGGRESYY